jgi:flagellar protein FlbD
VIQLTRLNNQPLAVNSDLVKFVETAPDTVITLITGEKVVVRESTEEVIRRIVEFRRSVLAGLPSMGANLGLANSLGSGAVSEDPPGGTSRG